MEAQRYAVVVPIHVTQLLRALPNGTAETLKERLFDAAHEAARALPPDAAPTLKTLELEGARLVYEHDPENQVLIALDVLGEI